MLSKPCVELYYHALSYCDMCSRLPFSTEYNSGVPGPQGAGAAPTLQCMPFTVLIKLFYTLNIEVWPFVPVAKDLKDLLKPVGGHWSLIWDKTHHWGDSFFLVHCQPLTNRKAVQGTLNCFPIGQLVVPDLTISTQISNLFSHLWQLYVQRSQIWDNQLTNRKAVQSTLNCFPIGQWLAVDQKEGVLCPEDLAIFNLLNILVLRQWTKTFIVFSLIF